MCGLFVCLLDGYFLFASVCCILYFVGLLVVSIVKFLYTSYSLSLCGSVLIFFVFSKKQGKTQNWVEANATDLNTVTEEKCTVLLEHKRQLTQSTLQAPISCRNKCCNCM